MVTAINDVVPLAAIDGVGPLAAIDGVVATATIDDVVASAAANDVAPFAAINRVRAASAVDGSPQLIGVARRDDQLPRRRRLPRLIIEELDGLAPFGDPLGIDARLVEPVEQIAVHLAEPEAIEVLPRQQAAGEPGFDLAFERRGCEDFVDDLRHLGERDRDAVDGQ